MRKKPFSEKKKNFNRKSRKSQHIVSFQWSLAARVVRDAPVETPVKAEGAADSNTFNLNEALSTLTQGIQKALSKENVDVSLLLISFVIFLSNLANQSLFRKSWKIWVRPERN